MTAPDLQQYVLMPETDARRALSGRRLTVRVLAPVGPYAGRGRLRVLRARPAGSSADAGQAIELVCGYEAYEHLPESPRLRSGSLRQPQDGLSDTSR
ncbi:MAG TPA: hypothetical protein VKT72_03080 [Candidatus Baltobacteraceae bacterium]|nr:hypothetical protein [Candidatus Baltobacteraceae bacterium]